MVGAVAESGAVEAGVMGLVDLLSRVAFHEQVDGHHTPTLQGSIQMPSEANILKHDDRISCFIVKGNNAVIPVQTTV